MYKVSELFVIMALAFFWKPLISVASKVDSNFFKKSIGSTETSISSWPR